MSVGIYAARVQLQDMTEIIKQSLKDLTVEERKKGL
ncbi:hypothetical protein DSM25559_1863 [Agrobacterium rosae]|uniref:Uncharacterized protein n=1 Tax=Agrobacterium rosae TaxID=1972867 RepID=A0A1R3TIV4_9HYPH|nr:hypothetical protein DSM25559_1863 [Agrobacterium rosae]